MGSIFTMTEHTSSLEPRLSVPDFVSQLIILQNCETKSGMESLGSRLEHCLISARKIVKWTVYLLVYIGLVCSVWVGKAKWLQKNTIMHLSKK